MNIFNKQVIFKNLLNYLPIIVLLFSVLNEFDFNYMNYKYFSFNFQYILIFYWSLKKAESLGYGTIFVAGLINDIVVGLPIGLSSLSYLLICGFAAYLRNITLRPTLVNDWLFFLFTILVVNSLINLVLILFFEFEIEFVVLLSKVIFTFLFYFFFAHIFRIYEKLVFGYNNDWTWSSYS